MKVVVSQYQDFVNYCLQINLIEEGQYILIPRVADHAEIRDCDVIGVLPLHLASLCNTITEVPLVIPPDLRGKKLNLDQIKEYARKPKTYIVELLEENDDQRG